MFFMKLTIFLLAAFLNVSFGQEIPKKCLLNRDVGPCKASMQRYYYNSRSKKCEKFVYGGCKGNENRFFAKHQCLSDCTPSIARSAKTNRCLSEPEKGPCRGRFPRFYYNSRTKTCETFIYGGCGGNENNFKTTYDCERQCA